MACEFLNNNKINYIERHPNGEKNDIATNGFIFKYNILDNWKMKNSHGLTIAKLENTWNLIQFHYWFIYNLNFFLK